MFHHRVNEAEVLHRGKNVLRNQVSRDAMFDSEHRNAKALANSELHECICGSSQVEAVGGVSGIFLPLAVESH